MGFAILLDKATLMGVPSLHYALSLSPNSHDGLCIFSDLFGTN